MKNSNEHEGAETEAEDLARREAEDEAAPDKGWDQDEYDRREEEKDWMVGVAVSPSSFLQ